MGFVRSFFRRFVGGVALVGCVIGVAAGSLEAQNHTTLRVESNSGPTGEVVRVPCVFEVAPGVSAIQGWSFGVCVDDPDVTLRATLPGEALLTLNQGGPVDFFEAPLVPGGMVNGVIICFGSCAVLDAGTTTTVLELEIELLGPAGATAPVEPCLIDGPNGWPIDNIVTVLPGVSVLLDLEPGEVEIVPPPSFIRGDFDDNGNFDIADGIVLASFLFSGGNAPSCLAAGDGNDDGAVDVADVFALLMTASGGSPPLPPPNSCGVDPTPDALACDASGCP